MTAPSRVRPRYRDYRVVERLGQGAMGAVYRAVDEVLGGDVALKIAHGGPRHDELQARLRNEADVLGRLVDAGVVRLLDFFEEDGDAVLVMAYVEGVDILRWAHGRTLRERLRALAQACDAVQAVHAAGFAHLDLKPSNIWMRADGTVQLLDFGTAWRLASSPQTVPMGTPLYMSPEHARLKTDKTGSVDARSDVYALGVTLYTLCTGGARPFAGPEEALLPMVMSFPPTDPRVFEPVLPDAVATLILRTMARAAQARPADVATLRDALLALASTVDDIDPTVAQGVLPDLYDPPSARQVAALLDGRLHVLRKAGSGAFASVYEVADPHSGQRWALKVVATGDPDSLEHRRFEREAEALERLSHPNVARYGTHFAMDGIGFITMEYVDGVDLSQMRGAGPREIVRMGVQLCSGVQAAHEAQVIHRDLKPANVRVTADGIVKIVDFGLSRLMDARSALTMTGSDLAGTLGYCAPESINSRPTPRFDLFSIGVMLYELLARLLPYAQGLEYINQYLRGEEPQAPPLPRAVPTDLRKIVEGLIQFDPSTRTPPTAAELEQLLTDLLASWGDAPAPAPSAVAQTPLSAGIPPHVPAALPLDSGEAPVVARRAFESGETLAAPRLFLDSGEASGVTRRMHDSGETPAVRREAGERRRGLVRFFGRVDEVDALLDFIHAGGAQGRVMVVSGPAGIGRTRLLKSVGRLAESTAPVRWVPVAVPAALTSGRKTASQLERLVTRAADADRDASPEAALRALCRSATVVLALDDAHHLDADALERLARLCDALDDTPLLVVAAFRTDAPIGAQRAARFDARFQPRTLSLQGLDLEAMQRLARDRIGLALDPNIATDLHARTAGNPGQFLALLSRAALRVTARADDIPVTPLIPAVEETLDDLTPDLRRAVALLTLLDGPFCSGLARAALGGALVAADRGADADLLLARLTERTTVQYDPQDDTYRFPSPVMREALAQSTRDAVDPDALAAAHAAIGTWLEAADRPYEAAAHFQEAGRPVDAVRCLERAGDQEDAPVSQRLDALHRLTAHLENDPSASRARLAKAMVTAGSVLRGRSAAEGRARIERGFAIAELCRDASARVLARCELAKALQHVDAALARELIEEALALLASPADDEERWHRAYALVMQGHLRLRQALSDATQSSTLRREAEDAWCEAERCLDEMRTRDDTLLRTILALSRGLQLQREQALDEARDAFTRAAQLAERGRHPVQMGAASLNLLLLLMQGFGPADEAQPLFTRTKRLLERAQDDGQLALLHANYAATLVERTSDWKDVAASYQEAARLQRRLSRPAQVYATLLNLAELRLLQRRFDEVLPLLEEASDIERTAPNIEHAHVLRHRIGAWHLLRPEPDVATACEALHDAMTMSDATADGYERAVIDATCALARTKARGQLDADIEDLLERALGRARDQGPHVLARVHRIWAECLLAPTSPSRDDTMRPAAIAHLEEALRLSLDSQYGIEEACARSLLGRLLGDAHPAAADHLRRARELRARLDAASLPGDELAPAAAPRR